MLQLEQRYPNENQWIAAEAHEGDRSKLNEERVMPTTTIELELSEHMFTALWKYGKCILWFHMQGILIEAKTS